MKCQAAADSKFTFVEVNCVFLLFIIALKMWYELGCVESAIKHLPANQTTNQLPNLYQISNLVDRNWVMQLNYE